MENNPKNITRDRLDNLCLLVTDGTHDSPKLQPNGIPFIKGKHISAGFVDFNNCDYITIEDHIKAIQRSKPEFGDILFSNIGSVGDAAYVNTRSEFSIKNVALFKPNPKIVDSKYLYYVVIGPKFKGELYAKRSGVAQPFFSLEMLRTHEVEYQRDLGTQRKIAAILSAYDDLIENNLRRIKILEEMAQSLYREWFVKFRFPGHEKVRMVDSALGRTPNTWRIVRAPDAIMIDPLTAVSKEGQKPFVPMSALADTSMLIGSYESRSGNSGSKFKNGDTLFARITPCLENGKTAFVQFLANDEAIAFGSTEFIVLRSRTLCPEYVYLLARSDDFRGNAIKSMSGASGRQRVQKECFDRFLLAHPDEGTLTHFSEHVKPQFRAIENLAKKNSALRETRDLLLPKLISGELDISELNIKIPEEAA